MPKDSEPIGQADFVGRCGGALRRRKSGEGERGRKNYECNFHRLAWCILRVIWRRGKDREKNAVQFFVPKTHV